MTAPAAGMGSEPTLRFDTAQLATGVRLHYAETGSPAGEPVLLLHGYTDSWFTFSPLLPHLPSTWRLLAPDQRGHGDSQRPPHGYSMAQLATDAAAFLDALGVPRATVVGHSMGSFVAQRLAIAHPERVSRLVLLGSYAHATAAALALQAEVHALADPVPNPFVRDFQMRTAHQPLPLAFIDQVVAVSRKLPAPLWRTLIDEAVAASTSTELAAITAPTLILWGEHDAIFDRAQQQILHDGIRGSILKSYPDCGHALHWEEPQRVARDIAGFLRH